MKSDFWEYYKLSEQEVKKVWENCLFVFDTNVLLNLYRYSNETSKDFIDVVEMIKDKVWLPYQVAKEFHVNRLDVISKEIKSYEGLIKDIKEINEKIKNKNRNPFLSKNLMNLFEEFQSSLVNESKAYTKKFELAIKENDEILERLIEIFNGRIGKKFTQDKADVIYKTGEKRYKNELPPGYKDNSKPFPDNYGDLLIWFQIIEHSKEVNKPIVFILDDRKEDWWYIHSGKIISPRVELLREFFEETSQFCCFYQPFQFLEYSRLFLGRTIKQDTLKEVNEFINDVESKNNEIIELTVKSVSDPSNITRFSEIIKSIGYQVSINQIDENIFQIITILPNIPDLERRFKQKYIPLLNDFKLFLIDYKKI